MNNSQIIERSHLIATKPVLMPDKDQLEAIRNEWIFKTPLSKDLTERARRVLPNGTQHTLPLTNPYPFFMNKGSGSKLWDVDGNTFTDFILSGGAIVLGHNDPILIQNITELLQHRTHFHGHFDELEIKAAEEVIAFFPSIEKVRFTSSGSEANTAAVKIARAATGKKKIIKFMGNYHGWHNEFLIDVEVPGSGKIISQGINDEVLNETILVPQNNLEALELAFKQAQNHGGVAAVIIEPFGAESGLMPYLDDFHPQALKLTHQYGALYILDEVVTGFRMGLGGAQKFLGINPDLTTLGKAMMNGFPSCGAVGGKKDLMDIVDVGVPMKQPYTFVSGTLSGNTLSMAACYHVVSTLRKTQKLALAESMTIKLVHKLNQLFTATDSDFFAYHFGSILRVEMTAPHAVAINSEQAIMDVLSRRKALSDYAMIVSSAGVLSRMGRDFVSAAHTEADLDQYVLAYEKLLHVLGKRTGFYLPKMRSYTLAETFLS
jgi:glutamate-1-semialdehyde 2,1-aminomutase